MFTLTGAACSESFSYKLSPCLHQRKRQKGIILPFRLYKTCSNTKMCPTKLLPTLLSLWLVGIGNGLFGLSSTCSGCKAFWSRTITCHSKRTALHTATCAAGWQSLDMLLKFDSHLIFYSKSLCTETQVEKKYRAENLRKSTVSIASLAHP